jgi:putative transposase
MASVPPCVLPWTPAPGSAGKFHLQQNARAHIPTRDLEEKVAEDIRRIFNAEDRAHVEEKLAAFVAEYASKASQLAAWGEVNLHEGFTVFSFPEAARKRLRTSYMSETLNSQIKRRTRVVGLFPGESSLLRLVTAVLVEISEEWETGKVYLQIKETKSTR